MATSIRMPAAAPAAAAASGAVPVVSSSSSSSSAAATEEEESYASAQSLLYAMITQNTRDRMTPEVVDDMVYYLKVLELDPDKLSVIHVAGTKGKGSTCVMVESILRHAHSAAAAAGGGVPGGPIKTGLFTSPHLVDVRERIRVGGAPVSRATYLRSFWYVHGRLQAAAEAGGHEGYVPQRSMPGFFRFLFLVATHAFLAEGVDVAILEVGLGGRLDATNIIRRPVITAVTRIDYDHVQVLGDTLTLIAGEKAGIFKGGVPAVVTMGQPEEAMAALRAHAAAKGAPLLEVPALGGGAAASDDAATVLAAADSTDPTTSNAVHAVGLAGAHHRYNAAVAVALANGWLMRARGGGTTLAAAASGGSSRQQSPPPPPPPEQLEELLAVRPEFMVGLQRCGETWYGRSQTLNLATLQPAPAPAPAPAAAATAAGGGGGAVIQMRLDGAHTPASLDCCGTWFRHVHAAAATAAAVQAHDPSSAATTKPPKPYTPPTTVLVWFSGPEREPVELLRMLLHATQGPGPDAVAVAGCPPSASSAELDSASSGGAPPPAVRFDHVLFTVNDFHPSLRGSSVASGPGAKASVAQASAAASCEEEEEDSWQARLAHAWEANAGGGQVTRCADVRAVLHRLAELSSSPKAGAAADRAGPPMQVLVTGSLLLVGDMLAELQRRGLWTPAYPRPVGGD
jgi:folylpolyglutamate synthase/dihydrofolate synthase